HLIERVSRFVHDAEKAREEIILVIARGKPDIAGHAAAERMRAFIKPAAREIETELFHELKSQLFLRGGRERTADRKWRLFVRLFTHDAGNESGKESGQIVKNRVNIGRARARVILIEHGVIGR